MQIDSLILASSPWVSEFTGLEWWNGMVEWTGGMDWNGGMEGWWVPAQCP